ncbi:protein detoxification 5 [Quercus suber]|uniref:Protein detoxification 5 n=1 Tax=Quercus suber TaxID=58331 RepID=A0AAW0MIM2_QUESU
MLGVYMKYSSACEKTRAIFSKDVFFSMRELFCFAIASAAMYSFFGYMYLVSLHFFCMPIIILLNGGRLRVLFCSLGFYLIQNWRLQCFRYVSQLLICTTTYHKDLPQQQGLRLSNELGAGNTQAAK